MPKPNLYFLKKLPPWAHGMHKSLDLQIAVAMGSRFPCTGRPASASTPAPIHGAHTGSRPRAHAVPCTACSSSYLGRPWSVTAAHAVAAGLLRGDTSCRRRDREPRAAPPSMLKPSHPSLLVASWAASEGPACLPRREMRK
jgi:hypothetical protein